MRAETWVAASTIADLKVRRQGSAASAVLLVALILSVALSPRIRLPFLPDRSIDLRVQDLLLVPALVVALLVPGNGLGLRRMWVLVLWLAWVAAAVTGLHEMLTPDPSAVVRLAFLARGLEPFLLAAVVCQLFVASGPRATRWALWALWVGVGANLLWFAYQLATGEVGTLLGADVGALIESYGPKLVGEASAFGTGAFWAAAAALAVAQYSTRTVRPTLMIVVLAAVTAAAYEAQSRIWLGAIAAFAVLLVVQRGGRSRTLRVLLCTAVLVGVAVVAAPALPTNGRLSTTGIDASVQDRVGTIWQPLVDAWSASPVTILIGFGPGGLAGTGLTEAHDLLLRALLDYGLIGAILLVAILWTVFVHARATAEDLTQPAELRMWAEFAKLSIVGLVIAGLVQDAFTAVTSSHLAMLAVGLYAGSCVLHGWPLTPAPAERHTPCRTGGHR